MGVSGQLHAPAALRPGKERRYPLNGSLDESERRSERFGEDPTGIQTPDRPASNPIATPTEVSRLPINK
jgi:hypothetical protein